MPLFNTIPISTSSGFKTIEIHHDDLTKLDWSIDVLVVSTYKNRYNPRPGTLLDGLINNREINVNNLSADPEIDLRSNMNTWVSKELKNDSIHRILCLEGMAESYAQGGDLNELMTDLFGTLSVMNLKGMDTSSVAMPVLGIGKQGLDLEAVLPSLVKHTLEMMEKLSGVRMVYLVHRNEFVAKRIDHEINKILGRNEQDLELVRQTKEMERVLDRIIGKVIRAKSKIRDGGKASLSELIRDLENPSIRNTELAASSRKSIEAIMKDLLNYQNGSYNPRASDLLKELEYKKNLSSWLKSYFYTVTNFGNSFLHDSDKSKSIHYSNEDVQIVLLSLDRVLDYYLNT